MTTVPVTTVRSVAPAIAAAEAMERLCRRAGIAERAGGHRALARKRLPHLELVRLPFVRVAVGGRSCVVCAHTGLTARLDLEGLVLDAGVHDAGTQDAGTQDAEAPATLPRARLVELGRAHLGRLGAFVGGADRDPGPPTVDAWALPFWVLHYERRPGRLDFAALDAIGGAHAGGAIRQALIAEMLGSARRATAAPTR